MHAFPRPSEPYLHVERTPAEGACPECGAEELADYRVLSEGGWWDVRKCQGCLASVSRERAPRFGSYTPLGLDV
jgi:vanillate/4-hydroxybenzoate decarboxylase subunit D